MVEAQIRQANKKIAQLKKELLELEEIKQDLRTGFDEICKKTMDKMREVMEDKKEREKRIEESD